MDIVFEEILMNIDSLLYCQNYTGQETDCMLDHFTGPFGAAMISKNCPSIDPSSLLALEDIFILKSHYLIRQD